MHSLASLLQEADPPLKLGRLDHSTMAFRDLGQGAGQARLRQSGALEASFAESALSEEVRFRRVVAFDLTTLPLFVDREAGDLANVPAYVRRIEKRHAYVTAMQIAGPKAVPPT